jgi:hypothetical protein
MPKSHLSSFSWMIAHSQSHAPEPTALLWHKTAGNPLKRRSIPLAADGLPTHNVV